MSTSHEDPEVTMMLCDSAQSIGGKLYILGGGWTRATVHPGTPIAMALAIRILVPRDSPDDHYDVHVALFNGDETPVDVGGGPVEARSTVSFRRSDDPDEPTSLVLAIGAGGLPLAAGGYAWRLELNGVKRATAAFRIS